MEFFIDKSTRNFIAGGLVSFKRNETAELLFLPEFALRHEAGLPVLANFLVPNIIASASNHLYLVIPGRLGIHGECDRASRQAEQEGLRDERTL